MRDVFGRWGVLNRARVPAFLLIGHLCLKFNVLGRFFPLPVMKTVEDRQQRLLKKTSSTKLRRNFEYLMSCVPRPIGPDGLRARRCCVVFQGAPAANALAKKLELELAQRDAEAAGCSACGGWFDFCVCVAPLVRWLLR